MDRQPAVPNAHDNSPLIGHSPGQGSDQFTTSSTAATHGVDIHEVSPEPTQHQSGSNSQQTTNMRRHAARSPVQVSAATSNNSNTNSSPQQFDIPSFMPIRKHFTTIELLGLFACSFSYAFCFNTINNIVIPKEVERLLPSRQSMWVGMIMAAGALSQLATPIVGAWSDRAGTRQPFLIYGTFITIIGIVIFLVVGTLSDVLMLFGAHVVTTVGLSVKYSMVTALLNDHVTEEQQGRASGCMAILAILGSGAGYAMFATSMPLHYSFCAYILAEVMCLGCTVIFIPGSSDVSAAAPTISNSSMAGSSGCGAAAADGSSDGSKSDGVSEAYPLGRSKSIGNDAVVAAATAAATVSNSSGGVKSTFQTCTSNLAHALSIPSPSKYPDFFYACLGRGLFNTGLAGQVYLVYYLRDVLAAENPVQITSMVAVMALLGGVVGALPSGIISDRVGKKPVIYGSVLVCVVSVILFMVVQGMNQMQMVGFVYGVGNVAYLSVDYALGVQSLPKRPATNDLDEKRFVPIDAAKDLGVFAMSATAGQLFGQVLYGALLDQFGNMTATGTQYSKDGFALVYGAAALCFIGSAVATMFVKAVK